VEAGGSCTTAMSSPKSGGVGMFAVGAVDAEAAGVVDEAESAEGDNARADAFLAFFLARVLMQCLR
jgi:hypothetical protein